VQCFGTQTIREVVHGKLVVTGVVRIDGQDVQVELIGEGQWKTI
jgi:hypothetical protein